MKKKFMYKDEYSNGKWKTLVSICRNLHELISFYGLNQDDVEWKLVSEEDAD